MTAMNLAKDSIVSFTPDRGWVATFKAPDGETWTEPVIGWAVVVGWTNYDGSDINAEDHSNEAQAETHLQAVVLDEGWSPVTVTDYLDVRLKGCQLVSIAPAEQ